MSAGTAAKWASRRTGGRSPDRSEASTVRLIISLTKEAVTPSVPRHHRVVGCRLAVCQLVLARREVRVDSPLDVHVLPFREPLGHRHDGSQLAAKVAGDPARELGGLGVVAQRAGRDLEQLTKAVRQAPEVTDIGGRRRVGGAHRSTMPEDE